MKAAVIQFTKNSLNIYNDDDSNEIVREAKILKKYLDAEEKRIILEENQSQEFIRRRFLDAGE